LCAACARGAYKEAASFKCLACSENYSESVLIMLMVVITTLVVIIGFTFATVADGGEAAAVDIVILKIAINAGIISAGASAFPLAWPKAVVTMFQMYAVASASAIGDSLSADCVLRESEMHPVQAWGLTMVAIPPGVIFLWVILFAVLRCVSRNVDYLKIHLPVSIIVTLTFAHPVATKAAVKLLACRRVAGVYFLDADFNIRCDSDKYMVWATTVAIPLLILFTFGMPLAYAAAMYRHVKKGTLMLERQVYGFFFSGFRSEIWWFELWNTLRKSLFTIAAVLFAPLGVMMQTWAALVLLLLFLVVFSVSQPYEQSYLNDLERSALSISVITLLSGLGLFTNEQAGEDAKTENFAIMLTFTIIFSNAMFVLNVIRTFVLHTQYLTICHRFQKKIEKKTKTFPATSVVPDQHIYAALKMRNNVNTAIQKEQEIQKEEASYKNKVKLVAEEIRIKAISKIGKKKWKKMTWKQRFQILDKGTKKNKTKKKVLNKRGSRLFSKSTIDRVVNANISNHVMEDATSAAALYKEKVIVRKEVASQRLRRRLSKRKTKVIELSKRKPVVPIQQIQETQQKKQSQKQLNIRQILVLRRRLKKIKSSRVHVGTCITASKKVHVTKAVQGETQEQPSDLVEEQQQIRSSDYFDLQSAVASRVANIPVSKIFHKFYSKKIGKIQYKQFKNLLKLMSDKKLSNNQMEEAWSYASNGTNEMDQNELKVWIDLCKESTEIERKKKKLDDLAKEFGIDEGVQVNE